MSKEIDRIVGPLMELQGARGVLDKWSEKKCPEGLRTYREDRNTTSMGGLPAYPPPDRSRR